MKSINYKSIFATIFITLISVVQLFANKGENLPTPRGSGGFDDKYVVGESIDDYIPFLFFMAIMLGVWIINKKKSTSTI